MTEQAVARTLTARREQEPDPATDRIAAQVAALDWARHRRRARRATAAPRPAGAADAGGVRARSPRLYARTRAVPQPRRHGPPRLRPRRVQVLRLPAAAARRRAARARSTRAWRRSPIAGTRRWASTRAIPPTHAAFLARCHARRPDAADAAAAAATARATTTACTRTSTASTSSRCRSAILLSEPGRDFTGGEFVLTEQRPRMQSRAEVVPLAPGRCAWSSPVHHRPVQGTRGVYRVNHAPRRQPRCARAARHTLGIIFHDAK